MKKFMLIGIAMLFAVSMCYSQNSFKAYGITLCGAEFGENNLPGVLNVHYTYPKTEEIDYFSSKGVQLIQLPFKWERIQKKLGGPLDVQELGLITKFVDQCAERNIRVTLILQNFGRYKINNVEYVVGNSIVTSDHLKDFWKKMAAAMSHKWNIFSFSLMSEPHDMGNNVWFQDAQKAIYGIREVDNHTNILVDGENYSGPETWEKFNDNLKFLVDPAGKMKFNAHCYFDADRTGHYNQSYQASGADEMTGVKRMKPFVDWLIYNHKKGYVGEFGVPKNDPQWLKVMENFLQYINKNNLEGSYWAAGSWWKNYPLSIEPVNNTDQPQMVLLTKYLQGNREASASINSPKPYYASMQ